MSNFKFLQKEWASLYSKIIIAEERAYTEPVYTASTCRLVLEESMHLLYSIEHIDKPFNTELVNLMSEEAVKRAVPTQLLDGLHIVRKTGNNASHFGNRITSKDSVISLRYLYAYLKWFVLNYSKTLPDLPQQFDEALIPAVGDKQRQLKELQAEQEKAANFRQDDKTAGQVLMNIQDYTKEVNKLQGELDAANKRLNVSDVIF
jgi:type I restriction enzyme R subunit